MMQPTSAHPLADALGSIVARIPAPIEARIAAGNAIVAAAGPYGIAIGDAAPTFRLPNAHGEHVSLDERLARGPVVLSFYRGDWCPFCNLELRAIAGINDRLLQLGASVLAISPQRPDDAAPAGDEVDLGFDVLSDIDQSVIESYQLLYSIDAGTRDLLEGVFHNDIAAHNADGTWRLPIPATFVLDANGIVRERFVDVDFRTRMEPDHILDIVSNLANNALS